MIIYLSNGPFHVPCHCLRPPPPLPPPPTLAPRPKSLSELLTTDWKTCSTDAFTILLCQNEASYCNWCMKRLWGEQSHFEQSTIWGHCIEVTLPACITYLVIGPPRANKDHHMDGWKRSLWLSPTTWNSHGICGSWEISWRSEIFFLWRSLVPRRQKKRMARFHKQELSVPKWVIHAKIMPTSLCFSKPLCYHYKHHAQAPFPLAQNSKPRQELNQRFRTPCIFFASSDSSLTKRPSNTLF